MDFFDDRRLRQIEQIIVSFYVLLPVTEPLTSKGGLVQPPLLDHRSHGSIRIRMRSLVAAQQASRRVPSLLNRIVSSY